jgi:hypothetical protein
VTELISPKETRRGGRTRIAQRLEGEDTGKKMLYDTVSGRDAIEIVFGTPRASIIPGTGMDRKHLDH